MVNGYFANIKKEILMKQLGGYRGKYEDILATAKGIDGGNGCDRFYHQTNLCVFG